MMASRTESPAKRSTKAKSGGARAAAPSRRRAAATAPETPPPLGRAGIAVRDGIGDQLLMMNRIEGEMVDLVKAAVTGALGAAGKVADEVAAVVRDVIAGAIQASGQAGVGLSASAKSIAKGVVLGVNEVDDDPRKAFRRATGLVLPQCSVTL